MSRISTSSSGGNVNIQDTNGNPITSTGGALDVNVISEGSEGFSALSPGFPTQVSIGTNSTQVFPLNLNRKYAHIMNNSNEEIFIQYQASAALNQGIRIPPGGFFTLESNNLWLGTVNAIGVMSNQLIDILEGE